MYSDEDKKEINQFMGRVDERTKTMLDSIKEFSVELKTFVTKEQFNMAHDAQEEKIEDLKKQVCGLRKSFLWLTVFTIIGLGFEFGLHHLDWVLQILKGL